MLARAAADTAVITARLSDVKSADLSKFRAAAYPDPRFAACVERINPNLLLKPGPVFTEDGESYVFAAINDGRFERRPIVAAPDAEGRLRVTSGLRAGERIVTDGAMLYTPSRYARAGRPVKRLSACAYH
ncbi:MAG: hypothetical protein JWO19_349 [Bryobacterales bacterium]|jgi:multidrug efflux pump subunit AcrA (membrane-fusion protein)|nr:hypothetical protein [Bryobacterales bacterium]